MDFIYEIEQRKLFHLLCRVGRELRGKGEKAGTI
jgi:hypothetical protein